MGWVKHLQNVCWFFHVSSFDSYFKVSFPFWIFLLWMLSQEKSLEWLQAAGAEGLYSDLPLALPHSWGTPWCFYTLKIKMLLKLSMILKKPWSVSSTALPGGSVIFSKESNVYFWWDSAPFTPSLVFLTAFQALHLIRRINTSQWQSLPSLWMECN